MTTLQFRGLKAFVHSLQNESARDLGLLREIQGTLDAIDLRCEFVRSANQSADHFIDLLRAAPLPPASAEDEDLVVVFEAARDSIAAEYEHTSMQHICAVNAPELVEDDGVVEAYAVLLTGLVELHDKLNTLSWIIREDEADQDQTLEGSFENADDLFAAMGM